MRTHSADIAGRRLRLTLEVPSEVPDALGGAALSFAPLVTVWGRIEALSGAETLDGARLEGRVDCRITLRWRAGIDARMRVSAGGRRFLIRSVFDPDGRKRNLVCLCQEVMP
jgi:SPP1 family predicted phage head-tail adaptor